MNRVIVLGFGKSGKAAAALYLKHGFKVVALDKAKPESPLNGIELKDDDVEKVDFSNVKELLLSPGISPSHPVVLEAKRRKIPVVGEIELGFRYFKNRAIGITGSNGKTTVTLLTTHVLNSAGIKARALGNVGVPLTSFNGDEKEILVVELSSFQLETLKEVCLDAALITNITPNHLDRYPSMDEYRSAKLEIQKVIKPNEVLFIHSNLKKWIEHESFNYDKIPLKIRGKYPIHKENLLAAFSLASYFGVKKKEFFSALKTFTPPPHRLECVGKKDGVTFYNDSKATTIESVIYAVKTLKGPVNLIVGGVDKGAPYFPWKKAFKNRVKRIYAIGLAAKKIKEELESDFEVILEDSMSQALSSAYKSAEVNDIILLSPGCSSYDSFRSFEHRGDEFRFQVQQLIK
ncbi:MAG TPA: Mur ligase family protein [Chlamydiales bacterium]|nr:Mur ligase family protein [Chlamydiales bacterium]